MIYIGDFRRNSVNQLIKSVYNKIKGINISFEFGISTRGIWENSLSDFTGLKTSVAQIYYDIFTDSRTLIKNNWFDYVTPQIYWEIGNKAADYWKFNPCCCN